MSNLTGRFRMLDIRWKVLDRAMNVSEVSAPGGTAFQAALLRQLATGFLGRLVFEASRAVDLFKLEQSQSFWQA